MAGQRFVLTMMLFVAITGSVIDIGGSAYGEMNWNNDIPNAENDLEGGWASNLIGLGLSSVFGFFKAIIPSTTGIWIIDNWVINPLFTFALYKGVILFRGGGG